MKVIQSIGSDEPKIVEKVAEALAKVLPSYAGRSCVGDYNYKDYFRGLWKFEKEWDYWNFLL